MTIDERERLFWAEVSNGIIDHHLRVGQAVSNVGLADIPDSEHDPFHDNNKIERFMVQWRLAWRNK